MKNKKERNYLSAITLADAPSPTPEALKCCFESLLSCTARQQTEQSLNNVKPVHTSGFTWQRSFNGLTCLRLFEPLKCKF